MQGCGGSSSYAVGRHGQNAAERHAGHEQAEVTQALGESFADYQLSNLRCIAAVVTPRAKSEKRIEI